MALRKDEAKRIKETVVFGTKEAKSHWFIYKIQKLRSCWQSYESKKA
jgi:hypothetical protein